MKRRHIIIFTLASIIGALLSGQMEARKIRTKLPAVKVRTTEEKTLEADGKVIVRRDSSSTWESMEKAIRFYGFDKTASSGIESFFIINGLDSTLTRVGVDIMYLDMKGRELHRRECRIDCTIPAQETRRVDVKTWDTQKSFYYHKSAKPKRQATPFDVKIELTSLEF